MHFLLLFLLAAPAWAEVRLARIPEGGVQPRVIMDDRGVIHLVYLKGDPGKSDVFYAHSEDAAATFSAPVRVNSQAGSAVAAGTIRGAEIALGKDARVHVAWNGSAIAQPKGPKNPDMPPDNQYNGLPMLYTRMAADGMSFEPQRNLMTLSYALDGGGSIAADQTGNVYIAWHAKADPAPKGEAGRRVWMVRSSDNGKTFAAETPIDDGSTGTCGCCGMELFAQGTNLYALFRSATREVHRDIYLLSSQDGGKSFRSKLIHKWDINACPMSSMSFSDSKSGLEGAWETDGQVYFSKLDGGAVIAAPGAGKRKHPRLAVNRAGETLLAWAEGAGRQTGGVLAWQVYDRDGKTVGAVGTAPGLPAFSFGALLAMKDGGFLILY